MVNVGLTEIPTVKPALGHPAPGCIESRLLGIKGKALMKAPWGVGFARGVCWR